MPFGRNPPRPKKERSQQHRSRGHSCCSCHGHAHESCIFRILSAVGCRLGTGIRQLWQDLLRWQGEPEAPLTSGDVGLAVVRTLAQWILDRPADGVDAGFAFDLSWPPLYDRCLQICYAAQTFLDAAPAGSKKVSGR